MRKTKIVCTLGPATDDPELLKKLMHAGMNVARINFSHGGYEENATKIATIKKVRETLNQPIPLCFQVPLLREFLQLLRCTYLRRL